MRVHADHLRDAGFEVTYVEHTGMRSTRDLVRGMRADGVARLHYIDVVDDWLHSALVEASNGAGLPPVRHSSPMFICSRDALEAQFGSGSLPRMARFYANQRVDRNILVQGGATGGRKVELR
jgi:deoxyribodipyrimidine photolyase-like uncharacterized protein